MFRSLGARIAGLGALVGLALIALGLLLAHAIGEARESFNWVTHTERTLKTIAEPVDNVHRAESDLRGAILSQDPRFLDNIRNELKSAKADSERLVQLTIDNPLQNARARDLRDALRKRIGFLEYGLSRQAQLIPAGSAPVNSRTEESRVLMLEVDRQKLQMLGEEQRLLARRARETNAALLWNKQLLFLGGALVAAVVLFMVMIVTRAVRQPTQQIIDAMNSLGSGDATVRMDMADFHTREFRQLARGYNGMAERLEQAIAQQRRSDDAVQASNVQLQARGEALRARSEVMEHLSAMAHRLQAARTDAEFAEVVHCFVPHVLPGMTGAVYAHNNSRNHLERIATWGDTIDLPRQFAPTECWALRLGQSHSVSGPCSDIACAHVTGEERAYHCQPLLASGELIGMLHLTDTLDPEQRFRLEALAENIASALVNHRLQRNLREQTIRDPLTNLFNRRYLEEALNTEVARATRRDDPLTVVMCDIDHFKRFNDEHGHDAGDRVLQAVAAEMQNFFRDGDIVCRFGGEEFTIVAPGIAAEALAPRIDQLRLAIGKLRLSHGGQALGPVHMSFGLAQWQSAMAGGAASLVAAADAALYAAKGAGRNRAVVAERLAA